MYFHELRGWLQVKVRERGLGLRNRLNAGSVCDEQRHCSGICGLRCYISETLPSSVIRILRGFQPMKLMMERSDVIRCADEHNWLWCLHVCVQDVCDLQELCLDSCHLSSENMFDISRYVNIQGGPKNWHTFLYALTPCALTASNLDRFSNLFHSLNQENICTIILSLKIPPHLKCVTTLPCEMSVS